MRGHCLSYEDLWRSSLNKCRKHFNQQNRQKKKKDVAHRNTSTQKIQCEEREEENFCMEFPPFITYITENSPLECTPTKPKNEKNKVPKFLKVKEKDPHSDFNGMSQHFAASPLQEVISAIWYLLSNFCLFSLSVLGAVGSSRGLWSHYLWTKVKHTLKPTDALMVWKLLVSTDYMTLFGLHPQAWPHWQPHS